MSRLIFLFAIAALIYLLLKSFSKKNPPQDKPTAENMVRCAQCGVHLPASESIRDGEEQFCSTAHRDTYRK